MNSDVTDRLPNSMYDWSRELEPYRRQDNRRVIVELLITFIPFVALWVVSSWAYLSGLLWLSLLIAVPAAGFLVRLFMIQHDCGHGSFVSPKWLGDWIGRTIGVLTMTPYGYWKKTHAVHHATCGNLDRRGMGDVRTLTILEYTALPVLQRLAYRFYRHPIVLFGLGPAYLFLIQHRLPLGLMSTGWSPWISTLGTNFSIAVLAAVLVWWLGPDTLAFVHLPIILLAASAGVWLFYVQHQFEYTSWARQGEWNYATAALHGSSYYVLPRAAQWLTANIGIHHVHHLCSRVPYYQLPKVMDALPALRDVGRISFWDSLRSVRLTLWDEDEKKLVCFAAASSLTARSPGPAQQWNDEKGETTCNIATRSGIRSS